MAARASAPAGPMFLRLARTAQKLPSLPLACTLAFGAPVALAQPSPVQPAAIDSARSPNDAAYDARRHDALIVERRVRPTALMPLWHVAGFALGAATALLGERAAMACTIAVEEVIDEHYAQQAAKLGDDEAPLRARIEEFRGHELEHKEVAEAHNGRDAGGYELLTAAIKTGSRLAIWLSERI